MTHCKTSASKRAAAFAAVVTVPFAMAAPADANPLGSPLQLTNDPLGFIEAGNPAIAAGKDKSLVVYERTRLLDSRGIGTTELLAQMLDANGAPLTAAVSLHSEDTGAMTDPDVAYNATRDEFYVVWKRDDFNDRAFFGELIRGRRVSSAGVPVGTVSDLGDDEPEDPAVAWSATEDEYLAVWEDDSDENIDGVEIDGDGTVGDEDIDFTNDQADDPAVPDVAHDATSNTWLVAFYADSVADEKERSAQDGGVFGQVVDADGADDEIFRIDADNGHEADSPSVVARGAEGGFRVAYSGLVSTPDGTTGPLRLLADRTTREIFTRDVAPDGSVAVDAVQISPRPADDPSGSESHEPSIARDGNSGQYLIAWEWSGFRFLQGRGFPSNQGVYGRAQNADGSTLGDEQKVSDQAALGFDFLRAGAVAIAYNAAACQFTSAFENQTEEPGVGTRGSDFRNDVFTRGYDAPDCPKAATTGGGAAAGTVTGPATQAASSQTFVKPPRRCVSRRRFTVNVSAGKGLSFRTLAISLAGKGLDVDIPEGRKLSFAVDLRGLVPGVYTLTIRAGLSNGRTLRQTRRYRACAVGQTTRLVRVDP